ncbi:MAG: FecR domain-containing protein [Polyangiaceae bacterium]
MNAPRFAKLAGALLAEQEHLREEAEAAPPPVDTKDRAHAIKAIERAIAERAKKKMRVRWMLGAAAIAASVMAIASTKMLMHSHADVIAASISSTETISVALAHATGNVSVTSPNSPVGAGVEGANVAAGSRIVTHDGGHAVLALSTGTRLAIDDTSDFSVVEEDATQIFSLASGSMRADVAKLKPGERFIIRTADAEVEVHGTSFSVGVVPADASCGGGSTTRVKVFEGVVTVRHSGDEARIPKGDSWPANCAATASDQNTDQSNATSAPDTVLELPNDAPQTAHAAATAHAPHGTNHSRKTGSSPLAEQNDIFESGLTAERDGLTMGAISDFERYLSLYPNGPLAEHAAVRHMNLLRTVDNTRAVAAAKDYLTQYPNGFARSEAAAIVAEKP